MQVWALPSWIHCDHLEDPEHVHITTLSFSSGESTALNVLIAVVLDHYEYVFETSFIHRSLETRVSKDLGLTYALFLHFAFNIAILNVFF